MSGNPPSLATFVRPQKKHFFAHINDNLCEQRLSEIYHPNIDYACYFKSVTRSDSLQFQVRGDIATKTIMPDQAARHERKY